MMFNGKVIQQILEIPALKKEWVRRNCRIKKAKRIFKAYIRAGFSRWKVKEWEYEIVKLEKRQRELYLAHVKRGSELAKKIGIL